jgi:hypothetical protein
MAMFETATEARVLSDPARARANENEAAGKALLDQVLRAGDVPANVRFVLDNLAGAVIALNAERGKATTVLDDIERRLADVERVLREGKDG